MPASGSLRSRAKPASTAAISKTVTEISTKGRTIMKTVIAAVSLTFAAIAFFLMALPPGSLPDFF
jgi:hypothetical protein